MEKERKDNKELTHVLTTKYDILKKKLECPVCQTGTFGFYSDKMVNIFIQRSTLYISLVGPQMHVFQVIHMFLEQLERISLKKQRSSIKYKKMKSKLKFQSSMMKPSSRQSK
jgi:hypothetical protein